MKEVLAEANAEVIERIKIGRNKICICEDLAKKKRCLAQNLAKRSYCGTT